MNKSFIKFITDFGPLLIFLFFYYHNDKNLKTAIPPLIIATIFALAIVWLLERKIPMIPLISGILISLFGGIISFFIILVITFYLVVEEDGMKRFIKSITPTKHQPYVSQLINKMQLKMGHWLRGQLLLSLIIFAMVFVVLSIFGIKYALILALVAGIFEIIPYLGPIMAAIPAVFFAFAQSPSKALLVIVIYFLIQRVENDIIVPRVLGKSVGLNPLVVILAILIGAKLGGAVGALLAVPVTTALSVYFMDVIAAKKTRETKLEA